MGTKHILPGLIMTTLLITSCYRKQDVITPAEKPVGAKGGNNQIRITAKHRDVTIDTCWVYIRHDATTLPQNWVFSDSMEVVPQNGSYQAIFDSLKPGNYYFYARGYSFDLLDTVTGGATLNIVDTNRRTYNLFMDVRNRDGK